MILHDSRRGTSERLRLLLAPAVAVLAWASLHAADVPYVPPGTDPADVPVGDYFAKWVLPIADFEERRHYRAQNSQLLASRPKLPMVVFLGDSITEGWQDLEGSTIAAGSAVAINRGIGGQVSTQMLLRFRDDVLRLKPEVLVLLAGTNDIRVVGPGMGSVPDLALRRLQDNLVSMVDLARANGIRVALCTLPPVHDYTFDPREFPVRNSVLRDPRTIREVNDQLHTLAGSRQIPLIDYYSAMLDERGFLKRELSDDGLHPNAAGYSVMRARVDAVLERLVTEGQAEVHNHARR